MTTHSDSGYDSDTTDSHEIRHGCGGYGGHSFLVWYFSSIVVYILVSAVLAIMGCPLVCRLTHIRIKGWQVPRWLAALATLVLIWTIVATLCSLFVPLVFNKVYQLSTLDIGSVMRTIEEPIARTQNYLRTFFRSPNRSSRCPRHSSRL